MGKMWTSTRAARWKKQLRTIIYLLLSVLLASTMLGGAFLAGVVLDRNGVISGVARVEPPDVASTFSVFWQAWNLVQQRYVDRQALDSTRMTYGAISGMLSSLGDVGHTRFLSPQALRAELDALQGRLEGIGAELGARNGQPTIVSPISGSPAQAAGLRAGDMIVRVDGKEVAGLPLDQVVGLIRGRAGTTVTLTVLHAGDSTLTDVKVTRASINVPSVSWARLPGADIAHILVRQTGEKATDQLVAALKAAQSEGATAIILDLRNNPGGLRDEAIGVASQFLRDGNVLIERDSQGRSTPFPVRSGGVTLDTPLAVLVNEGTASAAEIVAGAIQDYHRGTLIGATTVGTGTVLETFRLSDGSAIFLGTEEWLTPNGRQIWHRGVTPDIPVDLPPGAIPLTPNEEAGLSASQLQASQDTQLLRGIQELTNQLRH